MIKSLHIGRYVAQAEDFRVLEKFLQVLGMERVAGDKTMATFSAPLGLLSINALTHQYPAKLVKQLKNVARLIVLEVNNPDVVFDIARQMKLKLLSDSASPDGKRSFSLQLPGDLIVTVFGVPGVTAAVEGKLDARGLKFAVVVARFNAFITERLLEGALDGLVRAGAKRGDIEIVRVPGSFEIPAAARTLAETGRYDAVLCLGCLLRGETAHYDVIVNEVARGIGQSAQETGVPHAFGVLTCDTLEQAIDRAGLKMGNKGFEAALAAVEMVNVKKTVRRRSSVGRKTRAVRAAGNTRQRRPARKPR
jgi:6,7-dimethyl-8-ribityllumazine synthase